MNAIELFTASGDGPHAAMCARCKRVYPSDIDRLAESCCVCPICGGAEDAGKLHWECRFAHHKQAENAALASAQVVPYVDGWIYSVGVLGYRQDRFFHDVTELQEFCDAAEVTLPERVHPCTEMPYTGLDMAGAIERMADEHSEGWQDNLDGIAELNAAADAFNDLNKANVSYTPDTQRAFIVADALKTTE